MCLKLFPPFAPHLGIKNTVSKFYTARSQAFSSAVCTKKHCTALYKIWKLYLSLIYQICQNCQWFPIEKLENPVPARRRHGCLDGAPPCIPSPSADSAPQFACHPLPTNRPARPLGCIHSAPCTGRQKAFANNAFRAQKSGRKPRRLSFFHSVHHCRPAVGVLHPAPLDTREVVIELLRQLARPEIVDRHGIVPIEEFPDR